MTELLIHSMSEFSSLIMPCLEEAKVASIAEIGSEFGGMSRTLAEHCEANGGTLTCIDPEPAEGFAQWAAANAHVDHRAQPSLEALSDCSAVDAWFVDGDHNYYTVFNELPRLTRSSQKRANPCSPFCTMFRGLARGAISITRPSVFRPAGAIRTLMMQA